MAACPRCGEANPSRARFCSACGAPLEEAAAPREMRKTVTVIFSDVIDSTPLGEQLDAETYRRVISRYFIEVSLVLERHGGTVEKFIGDAVMAVFGIPIVHEDDALRAVRAATELREALGSLNEELRGEYGIELAVRTGINTGEVVAGDPAEGQAFATGDAVTLAQRLESSASPGEILIGDATHGLVRDAVLAEPVEPLTLKGKAQPVDAWRLLGVVTGAPAFARRLDSPLVGRERELTLFEQAFRRAVDEHACHLFTVLGTAGVGKSRLVTELFSKLGEEARVLMGRCVPYGEGITFWPLTELVRQAASISPRDSAEHARAQLASLLASEPEAEVVVDRLAAATGLGEGDATNEEAFWAVRKLIEALAQERPVVVAFDDVQWAEPTFLDLVEHLADWTRNAPVLLVCLARPELLDERPTWGGGKVNATSILLEPLRDNEVERLIGHLLGEAPPEIIAKLVASGEGNPLFVEEMLAMLVDRGRLQREDGSWRAVDELADVEAPPTIQALLAARLDQLTLGERGVLERAAVIGKLFSRENVAALLSEGAPLDELLSSLVRKDLIRPDRAGDEAFRFRHILVRDAAYQVLPKESRAGLHERFAAWLEDARRGRLREYEEILGYHLEQAHRYRSELGPADGRLGALATKAADLLASAGRRALARGDAPAAAGLLTRATLLLRDEERARLELAPELGSALFDLGELVRADAILSRAIEGAAAAGDRRLELRARLEHATIQGRLNPGLGTEALRRTAEEAISVFDQLGDELGLAKAWCRLADVHWMAAQWGARAEAFEKALVHARRAGSARDQSFILASLPISLLYGSTPVPEAIGRIQQILEETPGDRMVEARVLDDLGELHAMLGEFDEARRLYARSKEILEDLGLRLGLAVQTSAGGEIERLAGDPSAAEAELRSGYETLERMGEKAGLSTLAAFLAESIYSQGRHDEAERFTEISEAAAPREDVTSHVYLAGTRAKVLARRTQFEEAERMAREAAERSLETDSVGLQAHALMNLAEVLRFAGRPEEAVPPAEKAVDLYERKGNIVLRGRAQTWLAKLRTALTPTGDTG